MSTRCKLVNKQKSYFKNTNFPSANFRGQFLCVIVNICFARSVTTKQCLMRFCNLSNSVLIIYKLVIFFPKFDYFPIKGWHCQMIYPCPLEKQHNNPLPHPRPLLGSVSPTFWHKVQMWHQTAFGPKDAILFSHNNKTVPNFIYLYTQLEVTPNFYTLHSMPCARNIRVNLLLQKL